MLTPEQLKAIPESFVQQLQDLEDFIIADIARRIAKEGGLTDTSVMELNKALGMGTDLNRIERIINQVTDSAIADIDNVIRDAIDESIAADNVIYKAAGYNPVDLAKSATLTHILEAGIRQTQGDFKNLTRSMGFAVQQANGIVFKPIARFYQDIINQATLRLTTGVMDWKTSTRYAVREMASSGLRYVDYATGHVNRVDVAARRAILTGTNQLNLRMTDQIMDDLGLEYVETTAHMGARPEHQLWQGQVYHVGGAKGGYPDFVSATGYGTGPGLGGWNCRHSYFAFFPGISTRAYTDEQLRNIDPPPFTYDGKRYTYYEATQRQRELETRIRQTKRELVGYDAAGQKKEFTAASIKLNRQKELYEDFSRAAGIRIKPERHQLLEFGKSISQKAAWANKKYNQGPKNDIIRVRRNERLKAANSAVKVTQDRIDRVIKESLPHIRFVVPPAANNKLRYNGVTKYKSFPWGEINVTSIQIGKQKNASDLELIDTLLHEQLEAKILIRALNYKSKRFKALNNAGDKARHDYINRVIARYLRMRGLK